MRIVFFGTPYFSATNLNALINQGHNIVAVVTSSDSRKGRGKKLTHSHVKTVALNNNIPVLQPLNLKANDFIQKLTSFNADLFVVVAFRMLPDLVWKIPPQGTINLHTSLLPNYRGAAPINWVLINGEEKTGITTFFINQKIDSGNIILQKTINITQETSAGQLHEILMNEGSVLLFKTIELIAHNSLKQKEQNNDLALLEAPKLTKELLKIDWAQSAQDTHNLIRGLSPYLDENLKLNDVSICPCAWFFLKDIKGVQKRVKVYLSRVINQKSNRTPILRTDSKTYFNIITNNGTITILNLQIEGKKQMTIEKFLKGNRINENFTIL